MEPLVRLMSPQVTDLDTEQGNMKLQLMYLVFAHRTCNSFMLYLDGKALQLMSHTIATELRNKSFPFFDDLVQIFEKERATGAAVDAVENLGMEDNTFLDEPNVEDEGVKDSESIEEIEASNCQASVTATATMKIDISSKKRRRSDDGLFDLVEEMGKC
ncbi:hypothetical protein V6N11_044348 [Hibiscus sabdariffa]|uniref:Uncharacterized protein n=1 Tax=Hibiscus sabdariffa TaxID=183260 RepID=A0ABR2REY1_9ROSI